MPSAIRSKARRAFSHAGRMLSAGSKIPAGRWFWSLSTGGVLGAGAAGRGNQHRSAHPADALPSAEAALLGRVYRTEPDPTHPVPQRPTRRAPSRHR